MALDLGGPPKRQAQTATTGHRTAPSAGRADNPTRRTASLGASSMEDALASPQKPIGPRLQSSLWELVGRRAEELGVSVRVVLTDALVRALELDVETHAEHVRETDQRERLAIASRPRV